VCSIFGRAELSECGHDIGYVTFHLGMLALAGLRLARDLRRYLELE
jgi:hypothetical protein